MYGTAVRVKTNSFEFLSAIKRDTKLQEVVVVK